MNPILFVIIAVLMIPLFIATSYSESDTRDGKYQIVEPLPEGTKITDTLQRQIDSRTKICVFHWSNIELCPPLDKNANGDDLIHVRIIFPPEPTNLIDLYQDEIVSEELITKAIYSVDRWYDAHYTAITDFLATYDVDVILPTKGAPARQSFVWAHVPVNSLLGLESLNEVLYIEPAGWIFVDRVHSSPYTEADVEMVRSFLRQSQDTPSLREQLASKTPIDDLICKQGKILAERKVGSLVCVTPSTAEKRSWQVIKTEFESPKLAETVTMSYNDHPFLYGGVRLVNFEITTPINHARDYVPILDKSIADGIAQRLAKAVGESIIYTSIDEYIKAEGEPSHCGFFKRCERIINQTYLYYTDAKSWIRVNHDFGDDGSPIAAYFNNNLLLGRYDDQEKYIDEFLERGEFHGAYKSHINSHGGSTSTFDISYLLDGTMTFTFSTRFGTGVEYYGWDDILALYSPLTSIAEAEAKAAEITRTDEEIHSSRCKFKPVTFGEEGHKQIPPRLREINHVPFWAIHTGYCHVQEGLYDFPGSDGPKDDVLIYVDGLLGEVVFSTFQ